MATLTITTTTQEDARIVVAFGIDLGLGRNATAGEVKAAVVKYVKDIVRTTETRTATAALSITDIAPT